jgi:hypothetical protein
MTLIWVLGIVLENTPSSVTPGGSQEMNCRVTSEITEDFTTFLEMHPLKHESSSLMKKFMIEWCIPVTASNCQ